MAQLLEIQPDAEIVELRIVARPESIVLARLALNGVAAVAGAPPDVVTDLKLAVSEICTNAVLHAYAKTQAKEPLMTVRFVVQPGQLIVEVEDEGSGFDRSFKHLRGDAGEVADREGSGLGMGLTIVRAVTDDLAIESGVGGSRVVFGKRF